MYPILLAADFAAAHNRELLGQAQRNRGTHVAGLNQSIEAMVRTTARWVAQFRTLRVEPESAAA